ncbi:WD repeat-containing protein 90 isoform X2 [Cervus canadensis]|uniref:WD repeat-containing protein 90 isoform X2 n=1 Tax=Cervus canadensis TaxID=1574408 RepID=UPI001CA3565C|nr:WD repeat-containing protein 90 isoform X2 [Cervus canadensis]
MARVWQQPFLNVFRHFKVDEWKRSTKEGDVAAVTDKTLKCTVYRVRGSVSASNYIQLPKTSTQSLGLNGRYLYVLFRPLPAKHFVIHLDVSTEDSQVIRVSFSNLFKEFKSTATWLQFPFICEAGTTREGVAFPGARWTCLQLDLHDILLVYLHRCYSHLKGVRLCASMLVRSLYTSDLSFDPAITVAEARRAKLPVTPIPREMAFPVPKGESWHDRYVHIRFPSGSSHVPSELVQKSGFPPEAAGHVPRLLPSPAACSKPARDPRALVVQKHDPTASRWAPAMPRPLPEVRVSCERSEVSSVAGPGGCSQEPSAWVETTEEHAASDGLHVFAHQAMEPTAPEDAAPHEPPGRKQNLPEAALGKKCFQERSFLPDPILRLKGVIGFGGHSTKWALWTPDGAAVVYPCHAVIVVLHIETREQRLFLGHTEKVSALALDGSGSLLASAQAWPHSMLRLWDFQTGSCLALFRSPVHTLCSLSFSSSGELLCGVGKDRHGRTTVLVWDVAQLGRGREAIILAKAHSDADVQAFQVAFFDEARMASCGRGSVRLWRLRGGALRSCAVDLGEHHALEFTDLAFGPAQDGHTLYVCSRSGHILEIDHQRMAVRHARRLLPLQNPRDPLAQKQTFSLGPGIAISSLSVSRSVCAVGSEDGYLRLWPLDFSSVLLEAEHEGPITSVRVSPGGLRVLSTTSSGHLGFLDVPSQAYSVLLYDFASPEEAPRAVAFHPMQPTFFCGFSSGAVRSFSLEAAEVLVEHRCHRGAITGLATSPDGRFLFSTCSRGTLAQYHSGAPRCRVLRVAANVVCQEACPSSSVLVVSGDSRLLAFVGPSKYTVSVVDAASLDELLRVDVSALDLAGSCLDSAVALCFGSSPPGHLLVSTSSNTIAVLDARSGRVVRELSCGRPAACASLALSADGRFLLTAAERAVRLWDYAVQASPSCQVCATPPPQVYIGHSEPVRAVAFTPDQQQLLSVGDAIFLWDILVPREGCPPESVQGAPGAPLTCEADPDAEQLEGVASGARGPLQQVSVSPPALPPRPGVCAGPPEGFDGALFPSDESRGPEDPRQASGPSVMVQKEAGRAGEGACGVTGSPRDLGRRPHPCGWPSACSTGGARAWPPAHPNSYRHFTARYKASSPAQVGGVGVLLVPATGGCCGGQAQAAQPVVSEGSPPTPAPSSAVAPGVSLGQLSGPEAAGHPPPCAQPVPVGLGVSGAPAHRAGSLLPPHTSAFSRLLPAPQALPRSPCLASLLSHAPALCRLRPEPHLRAPSRPGLRAESEVGTRVLAASPQGLSLPPAGDEQLRLKAVVGYNGNGRANLVWRPDTGFFAYTCGCLVVVEDLHSGAQQHWLGHPEEISTLALSHDAQVLASASGRSSAASCCQIRLWDVPRGSCRQLLGHHDTAVQALAFSPDDRLLVTLGGYGDDTLALWNMATCELVSSTRLPEPVHGVAFNPWDAGKLTCVGRGVLTLQLLWGRAGDVSLQAHREPVPEEAGGWELSSLCYGATPLLYCGSSEGQVCVWDTRAGRCFLAWEADDGEIGVLLCSGTWLVSGSNTRRLRLWAVGAVPELRRRGSGARSSSVFLERELTLDGAVVSAVFHDSMDMGVVGTTAGTLWYISWAEGTSTRLISGHRGKVNEVAFSPDESHCATCSDDGSVRVWCVASTELLIQFQVLNQSCLCLAWSPLSCRRPEEQYVAAGYSDGALRIFSIPRTAVELKMYPHSAALTALAFSADGQTIVSGDKDGLVAVSHPCTGMTFRVLSDHRGAPICTLQSTRKEVTWSFLGGAGPGQGAGGTARENRAGDTHQPLSSQCGDFGAEGTDLWLAASGDQRVSVWASDWLRDHCELVDWLSFPAPGLTGVSVLAAPWARCPGRPPCTVPPQAPGCLPPSLAAFCPWNPALLVCAGLGVHPEVVFYSLRQKQVVEKIPLPFFAVSMSLSPGAHLVAIGFSERMVRLLDCASGAVQDFAGHDDSVQLCRFAPSAQLLFTAAYSEILVWEVTGR